LKYGTDRLSRNVGKELPLYASFSQNSADPEIECAYCTVETKYLTTVQSIQRGIRGVHRAHAQVFVRVIGFSLVIVIPPMILAHASIMGAV
jgi:hypothetical protein